jgi:photosystem II stability/assembly factor-like uncharacterized protein
MPRYSNTLKVIAASFAATAILSAGIDAQVGEWRKVGAPEGQVTIGVDYVDGMALVRLPAERGSMGWDRNVFQYESSDGGSQWQEAGVTFPSGETEFVDPLLVIGDKIYGHGNGAVYWSSDKGRTWNAMTGPSGYGNRYMHLYWSGSVLSNGKYVCDLDANAWSQVPTFSVGIHQFSRFARAGGNMVAVSSRTGIYYSEDGGSSWKASSFGPECVSLYTMNDRLYAIADGGGLYVSNDGGVNFTKTSDAIAGGFLKKVGDRLCCVDEKNNALHWISADGQTVTQMATGLWREIHDVTQAGSYLLSATDCGIFRSVDEGNSWYAANKGLGHQLIKRMSSAHFEGDTLYCATGTGAWRSLSHGERWTNLGIFSKPIHDIIAHNGKIYAAGDDAIYVSSNSGEDWERISVSLERYSGTYPVLFVHDDNVYFNNKGTIYQIGEAGLQQRITDVGRCWVTGGYIYSDKGQRTANLSSWENLQELANPENIQAGFASTPTHVYAAMMHSRFAPRNAEAYRSEDGISFAGFDAGLRRIIGSGGDCWLSAICAHGDTVFVYEQDGGTNPPRIMYATSTSSRWNAFASPEGQTGITLSTPLVSVSRSLHLGAYRYDFAEVPPAPAEVDNVEYVDPLTVTNRTIADGAQDIQGFLRHRGNGQIYLNLASSFGSVSRMELFDAHGRMLRKTSDPKALSAEGSIAIPSAGLGAGAYFIRIAGTKKNTVLRLTIYE